MRRPLRSTQTHLETKRKLKSLYFEYKILNKTKEDNIRLDYLIEIISRLEYKYITQLKSRYNI